MHIEAIKKVRARAMNKHFQYNVALKSHTTKLPKNKALKYVTM